MGAVIAIQANSNDDIDRNLAALTEHIARACQSGNERRQEADSPVVVLPECFGLMPSGTARLLQCAETDGEGKIQEFLSGVAKRNNVWMVGGSVPMRSADPGKITNSLLVYDNHGERVARYDKIFLFDVSLANGERYCESDYTLPGNRLEVVDTPAGKIGLSICYDLRFPELYRQLARMGAEILLAPSAFTHTTGKRHWMPLLTARAIENSCYVVAPAQYGQHNKKRITWGHTVIIDPWGTTMAELETGWGSIRARIDRQKLRLVRQQLPSLQHCRSDLFPF